MRSIQCIHCFTSTFSGLSSQQGDPDAGNVSPLQIIQEPIGMAVPSDDEPEDPEAIPEHKQHKQYMMHASVICTNFSLLYSSLDATRILLKLPDKELITEAQLKAANSYHQQFAQNVVVIDALLRLERPSNALLKFADILETTPGQKHIAKILLQGKLLKNYLLGKKSHPNISQTNRVYIAKKVVRICIKKTF